MADTTQSRGPMKQSAWAPLRIKAFRALWLAQVGSMIGTWMQTVGAQWLLVEEPGADALVAMVQVAAMLPVLVLALPSGALADILDRRRMLITVQLFQAPARAEEERDQKAGVDKEERSPRCGKAQRAVRLAQF